MILPSVGPATAVRVDDSRPRTSGRLTVWIRMQRTGTSGKRWHRMIYKSRIIIICAGLKYAARSGNDMAKSRMYNILCRYAKNRRRTQKKKKKNIMKNDYYNKIIKSETS